eukprot:2096295-Rhodomonas_salina.1
MHLEVEDQLHKHLKSPPRTHPQYPAEQPRTNHLLAEQTHTKSQYQPSSPVPNLSTSPAGPC